MNRPIKTVRQVIVPGFGVLIRCESRLPDSSCLVEYHQPRKRNRVDRKDDLPPIPLADGPVLAAKC